MKIPSIPQIYRHVNRWREILAILSKYGLADWISRLNIEVAKGVIKNREGHALARNSREARIRMAVEELGPTFIKFGQILSTRPDLVGVDLATELRNLQANVPADSPDTVCRIISEELGATVEEIFAEFELAPLASASIGQVHRARLKSGEAVVVKVQHDRIEDRIRVDLDMLVALAQLAELLPEWQRYRPASVVIEFQRTLRRELDFEREQRNLQQFSRDFTRNTAVRIPRCYPQYSTARVLTMEWLDGIKISEPEFFSRENLDLDLVTRRGAELYLEMIFTHGRYHADPHPGNLVLLENNVIGLLDFGMVGRLDESLREDVEEMLMALVDRDAYYLTSIITRLGSTPPGMDEPALAVDVADFVDHYGNQPIEAFDLSGALRELIEVVRRYQIVLPAPLSMLLKVLIMLEGTARQLSPKFALLEIMQPYRKKMIRRRLSPARQFKRMRRLYIESEQLVEALPRQLMDILQQVQSGKFDVHLDHRGLEPSVNRLVLGMLASALFLGSAILLSRGVGWKIQDISVIGALGCIISFLLGLRLFRAIRKSGHLDGKRPG